MDCDWTVVLGWARAIELPLTPLVPSAKMCSIRKFFVIAYHLHCAGFLVRDCVCILVANFGLTHCRLNLPGMSGALPPPPPRDTSGFERKLRSHSMETLLQSFDNKSSLDHHGAFLRSRVHDCSTCTKDPHHFHLCATTDSFHTHSYSTEMSEPGFWKRQRLPSLDSTVCALTVVRFVF